MERKYIRINLIVNNKVILPKLVIFAARFGDLMLLNISKKKIEYFMFSEKTKHQTS